MFNLPRRPLAIDQGGEERGSLYNLLVSWAAGDRSLLGFVPKCGMREEPGQTKNHISVRQRLTFRFRDFCQFRFRFRRIWSRKKSLGFGFGEFGLGKKFQLRKIWSRKKRLGFGFGKLGLGKEKKHNNKKETRPSKQCKSIPEEKKKRKNIGRRRISFLWRRR